MENYEGKASEKPSVLLSLKNEYKDSLNKLREINSQMERIEERIAPQPSEPAGCEKMQTPTGIIPELQYIQKELDAEIRRYGKLYERMSALL